MLRRVRRAASASPHSIEGKEEMRKVSSLTRSR